MPFSGSTILAVDDNEASCYSVCRNLERQGFKTVAANNGTDTLRLAKEAHPDLVVLDVNLPDVNGYEVCRRLKADEATKAIPVIFLSATYHSNHARDMGLAAGGDAFLFAPVEPTQLMMVINGSLQRARTQR